MKVKGEKQAKLLQFKFLILGEGAIGKSSIIERYWNNSFSGNYLATIGVDVRKKRLEINNHDIDIAINDTAGQERFRSITKMFYKGADGILVGFDLTEPNTLEQVNYWIGQIEANKSKEYPLSLILFGNKCDDKENIKVKEEDIKKMREKYDLEYFETSAKDGTNVQTIFEHLTKLTLKKRGFLKKVGLPDDTPIEEINIIEKEDQRIEYKKTFKKKKSKC